MQPYGPTQQQHIGLFTFYRQQAQLQNKFKFKIKSQNLNNILKKVTKNTQNQNKNKQQQQDNIKQRPLQTQRKSHKLRQITQENLLPQTKRTQLLINKSLIQLDNNKKQQPIKRQKTQTSQKSNKSTNKDKQKDDNLQTYKQFSKYLSQLDMLRSSKKKNPKIIVQKSYQYKSNSQLYENRKKNIEDIDRNKINVQFKKLALQPQQFGLSELSKSFVPISMHKKQKTGLKCYRKEKQQRNQKQKQQIKRIDQSIERVNISSTANNNINNVNNKQSVLQSLLQKYESSINPNNKKLISVHRLSAKVQKNKQSSTEIMRDNNNNNKDNYSNMKSQSLPRLKINLNDVLTTNNNKTNNRQQSNSIMSMSLQLQRSHQLRSKYQIRQVLKQDESILSLNKKIRSQIKRVKNESQHQVRHYLSMKPSQKEFYSIKDNNKSTCHNQNLLLIQSQQSVNQNNDSKLSSIYTKDKNNKNENENSQLSQKSPLTSIQRLNCQQFSFKKHKEMFCKRDEYLKNYKQKLKSNIFRIQRSQQSKMKGLMEDKKKEIIDNLIGKLSLL